MISLQWCMYNTAVQSAAHGLIQPVEWFCAAHNFCQEKYNFVLPAQAMDANGCFFKIASGDGLLTLKLKAF